MRRAVIALLPPALLCAWAMAGPPGKPAKESAKRVVIPFDFESKFDGGEYGRQLGEMVWKKLERRGGFVLPEAMQEVRDWCRQERFAPGPDTPLPKMREAVRKGLAGDIGIWGKVERAPGAREDVYDLWVYVADFSAEPAKMIYQRKVRTESVSQIAHTYVPEALDRLYGGPAEVAAAPGGDREERWRKAPNLVKGDFEKGRGAPDGWGPLPKDVRWAVEKKAGPRNRLLRFSVPPDVAESTGVLYYSDYFPVEPGATYRFQCRWRSTGTAAKVFVKCYADFPGGTGLAGESERREVYRSQQNLAGKPNVWNTHTEDFTPQHPQYAPRWGRVMLYAYYPAGSVEWDDVVVKQVAPALHGKAP